MNPALLDHCAEQAGFCEGMGSPFTADLLRAMAEDLSAGGPTADLVREYPAARSDWEAERVWSAARAFLVAERAWVEAFIRLPPQTNETRRAIALLPGFLELALRFDLPVETLELGASAGLNLYWDRFGYRTDSWSWGEGAAPLIDTEWRGPPPPLSARPRVRARAGCDLNPLDITQPAERLRLRAYIWPDQAERLARFDAAASLAEKERVHVDRADAAVWLQERLRGRAPDALTIVYHSVFLQYPPRDTGERIAAEIERAAADSPAPLAWLRMEPEAVLGGPRDSARFLVDLITWPGGERRVVATTDGHARFIEV